MPIILGCNAEIYSDFTSAVPGAVGCRSHRDEVIHEPCDVPARFPGEPGARVVASIRPYPDALLSGSLDRAMLAMLRDAAARFTAPQLTVWHEAGHLYQDLPYITPAVIRLMHVKMQTLCNQVSGVEYGCVVHGEIATIDKWIPYAPDALDWYGIDVHGNDPFDFTTYDQLKMYLDRYRTLAQHRSGLLYPRINVCATSSRDRAGRPSLFKNLAKWLHDHGGSRMLTSFLDDAAAGGIMGIGRRRHDRGPPAHRGQLRPSACRLRAQAWCVPGWPSQAVLNEPPAAGNRSPARALSRTSDDPHGVGTLEGTGMRTRKLLSISAALAAAAACVALVVPQAAARGRRLGNPVMTSGTCSDGTSTFTLKSQFDDTPFPQTVGAEFEVNTGVIGQTWQVTLTDNGVVFFDAPVETVGPEGGLNVTHPDQGSFAIAHTIAAQAVNLAGGAECAGQVVDQPIR